MKISYIFASSENPFQMKVNRQISLLLAVMVTVLSVSCKSQFELLLDSNDIPAKYEAAFAFFEAGKYSKAASLFDNLKIAVRGTAQDDTVNFYSAYSYFLYRDIPSAQQGFESFTSTFPRSPFYGESRYLYVECLYDGTYRYELDQTPTYAALRAMNQYSRDFPNSEYMPKVEEMMDNLNDRLERKEYESAKLYYTIEDFKSAHYALKLVLKENAENRYREDIMYYTVMSAYKYASNSIEKKQRERYMVFSDDYFTFVSEFPDSEYRKELDGLAAKVQKILDKNKLAN